MGRLRPEEISSILKGAITDYENRVRTEEVGQVLEVGDGIARVHGLTNAMYQEMLEFEDSRGEKITGLALNLEEDNVGVIVAGDDTHIQEGNTVTRTERLASVSVRLTVLPSWMWVSSPAMMTPTLSSSRLSARPMILFPRVSSNSSISWYMAFVRPWTRAMPSPTSRTCPTSSVRTRFS